MNARIFIAYGTLTLFVPTACRSHATPHEQTCDGVLTKLSSGPYDDLSRSNERFNIDDTSYSGCVIRLVGSAAEMTEAQFPGTLFGTSLPYCPDGELPPGPPPEVPNEFGWCGDRMADGPDGTSYLVHRDDVFCAVEGNWDGGDDVDSAYVSSSRVEVVVRCATGYGSRSRL